MPRILYIPGYKLPSRSNPVVNGGDLRYSINAICALLDGGHQVTVIDKGRSGTHSPDFEVLLSRTKVESVVNLSVVPYSSFLSRFGPSFDISLRRFLIFRRLIRAHDLVITNTALSLELLTRHRVPFLYNASGLMDVRNYSSRKFEMLKSLIIRRIRDPLRRATWRRCVVVNTTAPGESELLASLGVNPARIRSVLTCSNILQGEDLDQSASPWDVGVLRVLIVGRLSPAKNQVDVISALSGLQGVGIVVAGTSHSHDPSYAVRVQELVRQSPNGSLTLESPVSEGRLAFLYDRADVVVVMSTGYDPLPTVISEALAFKNVVVSTRSATRSHFRVAGDAYIELEEGDLKSLREVVAFLERDRSSLETRKEGTSNASSLFSFNRFSEEYNSLVSLCLQSHIGCGEL